MISKFGRNKKIIFSIIIIAIIGSAFSLSGTFSYDSSIAHPNIAVLAAELYNENAESRLSAEEISWIRQGAFNEDKPIRWMHHFYDPTNGKGVFYIYKYHLSSKDWAQSPSAQEKFILGDYSWQRALYDYQRGDKKQALIGLGHIIHLISDASVPAHTRNDPHETGDSYEQFVKHNWDILLRGLEKVEKPIVHFDTLDAYFDDMAGYVNKNFYSDSTLDDKDYAEIFYDNYEEIKIDDKEFIIFKSAEGLNIYMKRKLDKGWENNILKIIKFDLKKTINEPLVLTSYTKHLLPKAIGHSAGIIDLFLKEVEKEQNFAFDEDRENISATNYLLGYIIEKVSGLKENAPKINVVMADENTVMTIMNDSDTDTLINANVTDNADEGGPFLVEESSPGAPPAGREGGDGDVANNADKFDEKNKDINKIQEAITQTQTTNQAQNNYEFSFAFGSGGEVNPAFASDPVTAEEPQEEGEQNTTTTEDITEDEENNDSSEENEQSFPPEEGAGNAGDEPLPEESETPTTTEEIIDTTAPAVNLSLDNLQVSTHSTSSGQALTTSTIDLSWSAADEESEIDYFNIEYKKDDNDWQILFASTTAVTSTVQVDIFFTYHFRAQAADTAGNLSDWTEKQIIIDYSKSVVINEVAWAGMAANKSSDEWIELYNNTDEDIALADWSLTVSGKPINWGNTGSTIPAKSYYLLERTDDDTVADITADGLFTILGGLNNDGEELALLDNEGQIMDQIDNSGGWFAGGKGAAYKTMERINPNLPGNWESNWQTADSIPARGQGQGGVRIYGSPRQGNHGYWYLIAPAFYYNFDENNNLTLTRENGPYIFDGATEIPEGYSITIEPGVILVGATDDAYITVKGKLIINGTQDQPVIFTSRKDIAYFNCGIANFLFGLERDCDENDAQPGDWSRLDVAEGGRLSARNVKFFYGGQEYSKAGGFVFGGKKPARIINNFGGEIDLDQAEFRNNYFHTDATGADYDALVWIEPKSATVFSTTTVTNSLFVDGSVAIKNSQKSYLEINNSEFTEFTSPYGVIHSRYTWPVLNNNLIEDNAKDTVYLWDYIISDDETIPESGEYVLSGVSVSAGAVLTVSPGTIINFLEANGMIVNGDIIARGTEAEPIIMRPLKEDTYWAGLNFSHSTSTLEYVELSRANYKNAFNPERGGALVLKDSNLTLKNVFLSDARLPYNMVYAEDSMLYVSDSNIFWSESKGDVAWLIHGILLQDSYLYLNNTYFAEMDYGIRAFGESEGDKENMTDEHFTNIKFDNWLPYDLFFF